MNTQHDLGSLLLRFSELAPSSPWGVSHHAYFPGEGVRRGHIVFSFLTHGNEFGSLPAAVRLLEEFSSGAERALGPTSLLLGNVEAARRDVRFVEEDFNRVFTFDRPADNWERRRADEVRPLLDDADFFLDVHQTQTATQSAFWTFPWSCDLALWARATGAAPLGLTRSPGGAFSPGKRCLDEYVRDRNKTGLTVEIGTRGWDDAQEENCYQSCKRLLNVYDAVAEGASLSELALRQPAIRWFETTQIVLATSAKVRLKPGLGCWTEVRKGELLTAPGAPEVRAELTGRALFPKYPKEGQPPPPELVRIARPLEDPEAAFAGLENP